MGYMGFGMQRWIYTMRPRKPFSGKRQRGLDMDQDKPSRSLSVSGSTGADPKKLSQNIIKRTGEIGQRWWFDRIFNLVYVAILLGAVVYLLIKYVF